MDEYIEREKLLHGIETIARCPGGINVDTMYHLIQHYPGADVVPVRSELLKTVKLLEQNYERGLNSDYVRDPMAWALYQTWRAMERGTGNG